MNGCSRTAVSTTPRNAESRSARSAVAVAYSAGRDSTALLHATLVAAQPLGIRVVALHVHHGLSPYADAWLRHGQERCRRWARAGFDIAFCCERLTAQPARGESVEAWARRERYGALRRMAADQGCEIVLLAHHRRDQAETFLLQALRGGGASALAAMPRLALREGIAWARPWLARPREAIESYVRRHRLRFVDDDSNGDTRFARNRLRSAVWPNLSAAFPDAEAAFAAASGRAHDASAAIVEWAEADLNEVAQRESLVIAAWRGLSPVRQRMALQAWLARQMNRGVPAALVDRLMLEIDARAALRWPTPQGELRSHRGLLRLHGPAMAGGSARTNERLRVDLSTSGTRAIAEWHGAFVIDRVVSGGLALHVAADLELRSRAGGERFKAGADRPARSLKLQYQAAGIEAGERHGPLAFHGDVLVFASGLGIDARAIAPAGEPQVGLAWRARCAAPAKDEESSPSRR